MRFWRPLAPALAFLALAGCGEGVPAQDAAALWDQGITFSAFLEQADRRRETWVANHDRARVPDDLLARARGIAGSWRILAVAEDWCGDSVHTLPYVAALAEAVPGLELRVVDSRVGRGVMEAHRTPDGRAATPTMVLLDDGNGEAGCLVERPTELQTWWLENPEGLSDDDKLARKYEWYEADAGLATMREMVERLEAAAAGTPVCPAGGAP